MSSAGPLRVLHCPGLVGEYGPALARAERQVGLASHSVAYAGNYLGYSADEFLWTEQTGRIRREWLRWKLLRRAMRDFDIVHFNFGMSLMPQSAFGPDGRRGGAKGWLQRLYLGLFELADLAWLRRAGKKIVVSYQGDDARQGDFCQRHHGFDVQGELEPGYYGVQADEHKRWRISQFAQHASLIYATNPDLLHLLPPQARFVAYPTVDPRDWGHVGVAPLEGREPLVLHAPTHRGIKGTRHILAAVERLRQEGVPFRFVLVEKMSQAEARRIFVEADLLVDQLLLGWYGGLGVELMALGKPVICHIRQADLHFIPPQMRAELPLIDATPATIYPVLKEWLTVRREQLPALGERSRRFVERWHDPVKIAADLAHDYQEAMRESKVG